MSNVHVSATPNPTTRILLVDDHPLVRRGLRAALADEPDLQVCGESDSARGALDQVRRLRPNLVIVDLSLADVSGLELLKQLRSQAPWAKTLVASMHDEALFAQRSLRAGASGYISKEEAVEHVVTAIRQVLAGRIYLSPSMTEKLLQVAAGRPAQLLTADPVSALSDRELEVFELLGRGMGTRQIADRLHLSVKTIETHRESIKRKLQIKTSNELVCNAVEWVLDRDAIPADLA